MEDDARFCVSSLEMDEAKSSHLVPCNCCLMVVIAVVVDFCSLSLLNYYNFHFILLLGVWTRPLTKKTYFFLWKMEIMKKKHKFPPSSRWRKWEIWIMRSCGQHQFIADEEKCDARERNLSNGECVRCVKCHKLYFSSHFCASVERVSFHFVNCQTSVY